LEVKCKEQQEDEKSLEAIKLLSSASPRTFSWKRVPGARTAHSDDAGMRSKLAARKRKLMKDVEGPSHSICDKVYEEDTRGRITLQEFLDEALKPGAKLKQKKAEEKVSGEFGGVSMSFSNKEE
jgi:hypothetical protein